MKALPLILFLFISLQWAHAQKADSVLSKQTAKADSLQSIVKFKREGFTTRANHYDSTLQKPERKLDSIQSEFNQRTDSLQQAYGRRLSKLDSTTNLFNIKLDSLKALNLPTRKYTHKLDSITQLQQQTKAKAEQKLSSIKSKANDKIKSLELSPELQSKVDGVTKNIGSVNLPTKNLNIPGLSTPGNPLSKIGDMNTKSPLGNIPKVDGLKDIQSTTGEISKVTGEVGGYSKDLKSISTGNLNDVKELPKAAETKAAEFAGVKDLQSQTKALDGYKDQLGNLKDPDKQKAEALQQVQKLAVDHFAGKEQVLQQAMDKVSKYKRKYSNLQSLEDIKNKRPNEMRGKPLIERIVPGIAIQIHTRHDLLFDFNPYVGYRFTRKITAGAGWNQRWAYNKQQKKFEHKYRIYGPRLFVEYNLFKGLSPRVEIESMNTFVPNNFGSSPTPDIGRREWIWSGFAGIKKDYKFMKHVKGTTMIMFNLYNPLRKSPYADVLNVRFGFEFPMKKRVKTEVKN